MSMKERDRERFLARQAEEKARREAAKPPRKARRRISERHASSEEQRARYLDCGPQMWDDRGDF
jgi:hypothetical protein